MTFGSSVGVCLRFARTAPRAPSSSRRRRKTRLAALPVSSRPSDFPERSAILGSSLPPVRHRRASLQERASISPGRCSLPSPPSGHPVGTTVRVPADPFRVSTLPGRPREHSTGSRPSGPFIHPLLSKIVVPSIRYSSHLHRRVKNDPSRGSVRIDVPPRQVPPKSV